LKTLMYVADVVILRMRVRVWRYSGVEREKKGGRTMVEREKGTIGDKDIVLSLDYL
jgi:hypothetical protein